MTRAARLLNLAATAVLAAAFLWLLTLSPSRAAECGIASYYAHAHHGKTMANGKPFNMHAMTAAMWDVPLGSKVRVTSGKRSVVVTITDRGPARKLNRVIDLSLGAFEQLAHRDQGLVRVCVERLWASGRDP